MPPLTEAKPASTALLTIHGQGGAWGIPSVAVTSVERWTGRDGEALDLLSLLGIASVVPPVTHDARVLLLDVQGERFGLLVHGTLKLAQTSADDLLPLPASLQTSTPLISHLAIIDGKPALFVVSPERLLEAARGTTAPFRATGPAPHDSAAR